MLQACLEVTKERGWKQYHTPRNMALDLAREVGEAIEHFVWASNQQIKNDKKRVDEIADELGDVLHALLLLSDSLKIDLPKAFWEKLEKTKKKYSVKTSYGKSGYDVKYRK